MIVYTPYCFCVYMFIPPNTTPLLNIEIGDDPRSSLFNQKNIITMNTNFVVEQVQLKGSSTLSLVDFCKMNNVVPQTMIKTKDNGYDALLFTNLTDKTKGFSVLIGTSAYAGEPVSRDWGVYKNEKGYLRISTTQRAAIEWA